MTKHKEIIYKVSAVLILVAAVAYLFFPYKASWMMTVGVLAFSITTVLSPYPGSSVRGKRLHNFQLFSCMLMFVGVYFMFTNNNAWALAMLIAAVFLIYSSSIIYSEYEKEQRE